MDEGEWLACSAPDAMLRFIQQQTRRHAPRRKLRLFVCGCCRLGWDFITAPVARQVVEVAERFADGQATSQERDSTRAALTAGRRRDPSCAWRSASFLASLAAERTRLLWDAAQQSVASLVHLRVLASLGPNAHQRPGSEWKRSQAEQRVVLAALVREVFCNPFRPASLDPAWRTPTVLALAQAAYEHRTLPAGTLEPERLAVLADALEESGCTDAEILPPARQWTPLERVLGG